MDTTTLRPYWAPDDGCKYIYLNYFLSATDGRGPLLPPEPGRGC